MSQAPERDMNAWPAKMWQGCKILQSEAIPDWRCASAHASLVYLEEPPVKSGVGSWPVVVVGASAARRRGGHRWGRTWVCAGALPIDVGGSASITGGTWVGAEALPIEKYRLRRPGYARKRSPSMMPMSMRRSTSSMS